MALSELAQVIRNDFSTAGRRYVEEGRPGYLSPTEYHLERLRNENRLDELIKLTDEELLSVAKELLPVLMIVHPENKFSNPLDVLVDNLKVLRGAAGWIKEGVSIPRAITNVVGLWP